MKRKKLFENLDQVSTLKSFKDMRQWRRERRTKKRKTGFVVPQSEHKEVEYLQNNRTDTTITWIGHATFLIQSAGLNIVTDPVWATYLGVAKRLSAPGLSLRELPPIDFVLISHAHYDHLSIRSIRALPGRPALLVPEGLSPLLKRKGFDDVIERSWWQGYQQVEVAFDFVPAQHWTRRTLWDTNTSHWGGWMIRNLAEEETIYYAGDSGYFRGFKLIHEAYPSIDVALLPIGAYDPEWFMKEVHMTPEEAVQAYLDLKAKHFIPMHYGAYRLADDTAEEAITRLQAAWARFDLPKDKLHILPLGETLRMAKLIP